MTMHCRPLGVWFGKIFGTLILPPATAERELAVILPYTGKRAASAIGERIRVAVFEVFAGEKNATVTISVGGTSLISGTIAPETFIKRADKALYAAKAAGKNRLCFESPNER